jgi:hypothetical protein
MIYLASDFNEIVDRRLEPGKLRLMRRETINMATRYLLNIVYMSTITNMATMRNFEVIPDRFNLGRVRA